MSKPLEDKQPRAVAEYVDGMIRVYDVEGGREREESELITSHEQFHYMLRLKSSFGIYLTLLLSSLTNNSEPPSSFALQVLGSRFRTSDEILATYASARMAMWHYGVELIRAILDRYPTYSNYYGIGESLVGDPKLPLLAATSVEAVIRFCWSPVGLTDFSNVSLSNLHRQLSADQFPDKRLERFIKIWSVRDSREQSAAMTTGIPDFEEALASPYRAWLDPFYNVIEQAKVQNRLLMLGADAQAERATKIAENREVLNRFAAGACMEGLRVLKQQVQGHCIGMRAARNAP
jgi:hypothetical protein